MSLRVASPLKATTRERQLHVAVYASHAQQHISNTLATH